MHLKNIAALLLVSALIFSLPACSFIGGNIGIVDAKIVTAVDERLMPVKVTDVFPKGTATVSCWIRWKNASINTEIVARWHYVTDDIHILDYTLVIPKREGTGSVMLTMPNGKELPSGDYKLELFSGKRLLRSLTFKVE